MFHGLLQVRSRLEYASLSAGRPLGYRRFTGRGTLVHGDRREIPRHSPGASFYCPDSLLGHSRRLFQREDSGKMGNPLLDESDDGCGRDFSLHSSRQSVSPDESSHPQPRPKYSDLRHRGFQFPADGERVCGCYLREKR